ncbi:MAG: c-type cytochrome [Nitrospirae bacterium]|nr:c-type cytochrome [Nitrospirota bacterium]
MNKKSLLVLSVFILMTAFGTAGVAQEKSGLTGQELFKEHCAVCHPDGGNIINTSKTLRKADREAHGIRNRSDIIEKMRHPGKGMTSWSASTISDRDAAEIADYILKNF